MFVVRKTFGDVLYEMRTRKGLSRYRLAQLSGVSQRNLYSIEKNKCDPKLATLLLLADALDVLPGTLIDLYAEQLRQQRDVGE